MMMLMILMATTEPTGSSPGSGCTTPSRTDIGFYLGRRTLILGDINSGKTHLTAAILDGMCAAGLGNKICVLDLAPQRQRSIGGKMTIPAHQGVLYLTCDITAPRLTGRTPAEMLELARRNAQAIDMLLEQTLAAGREILVVNDASLYLQAGSLERFWKVAAAHTTALINAYLGDSFGPAPFTRTERDHVQALSRRCDRVIEMPFR